LFPQAGRRYHVVFAPVLNAGQAGWGGAVLVGAEAPAAAGLGWVGGGYPSASSPVVAANTYGGRAGPAPRGKVVVWLLTAANVAAVRVGNQTIATTTSPDVPAGDRVAVFFEPADGPPVIVPPPQAKLPYKVPALLRHGVMITLTPVALDAAGQAIKPGRAPQTPLPMRFENWNRQRAAVGVRRQPQPGACEISQHGHPALKAEWGTNLAAVQAVTGATGELLLSCSDIEYQFGSAVLTAAILVNAQHPGAMPGPIPGTRPVAGQSGVVAGNGEAARREGAAWILVSGTPDAITVLDALTISRLDLTAKPPSLAETLAVRTRACLNTAGLDTLPGEEPFGPYNLNVPFGPRASASIDIYNTTQQAGRDAGIERSLAHHVVPPMHPAQVQRHGPATVLWYGPTPSREAVEVQRCLPR
jgi:hypothetical protein